MYSGASADIGEALSKQGLKKNLHHSQNLLTFVPLNDDNRKRGNAPTFPLFVVNTSKIVVEAKIEALLEERFREPDLNDCFTVEVKLNAGNRLEVAFDSDSGVTLEKCRIVSRFLEAHLDEEGWLGEKYALDVSSPGIGRPLAFRRQYTRNLGRTVLVTLTDDTAHKGVLQAADENQITIEEEVKVEKNGKTKKTKVLTVIPFDNIKSTVVKVIF